MVRCGVGARMPLAIEHPGHRASSPTSWIPCCLAKHLKPIQSVGYKDGLVCLAEHLLYLQVRLKNCRTALGTIVHNFMIYIRVGGQSNKARKQSSNESRAPRIDVRGRAKPEMLRPLRLTLRRVLRRTGPEPRRRREMRKDLRMVWLSGRRPCRPLRATGPCLPASPLRLDQPIRFLTLEPIVKQSLWILSSHQFDKELDKNNEQ